MRQVIKRYSGEIVIYTKQTSDCFTKENRPNDKVGKIKYLTVLNKNDTRCKYFSTTDRYFDYLINHEGFTEID